MRKVRLLIPLVLLLVFTACAFDASFVETSHDVLLSSQVAYDTAMKTAADLDKRGQLSSEDKQKVVDAARTYSKVHNACVEALAKYVESGDLEDRDLLLQQISNASDALIDFLDILRPYLED